MTENNQRNFNIDVSVSLRNFTHFLQGYFTGIETIMQLPCASEATQKEMGQGI